MTPPCPSGKIPYPNRWAARRALAHRQTAGGEQRRVYRCPFCRQYHMTKMNRQRTSDE